MAYTELIKNFERIRGYMREFYVYGFKSRDQFSKKSGRSYDNERRRVESWLGDYMGFRQDASGKQVFLSIDSRREVRNPLYKALKSCSFTDGDITLHFILLDILRDALEAGALAAGEGWLTQKEIMDRLESGYLAKFLNPMVFDESTVRGKLKEYVNLGLMERRKEGKQVFFRLAEGELPKDQGWEEALEFFSEEGLCGAAGSFLMDRAGLHREDSRRQGGTAHDGYGESSFCFKHHSITHVLDSQVLCQLLEAITARHIVEITNSGRRRRPGQGDTVHRIIPMKIFISVQNGRRYLMAYHLDLRRFLSYRVDYIIQVKDGGPAIGFEVLREKLGRMKEHIWGVSLGSDSLGRKPEHVEFTVRIGEDEQYILQRLLREKRCGQLEQVSERIWRFTADVYDTSEMIPWIRTFICRIVTMDFSNRTVENQFRKDLEEMYRMYGLIQEEGGGEA